MAWSKLVDMELDDEDKMDLAVPQISSQPDYPWGLRICLCEKELEKLKLPVPEVGDYLDMRSFGRVTSVSTEQRDGKDCCRVEIQIEQIAVEDENTEDMR
jgi:hypothetical protein